MGTAVRPVVAALAVVCRNGRVLLARRDHEPDRERWGFPGGKVEPGETVAAAAERELREETGLRSRAREVLGVRDVIRYGADGALAHHYVLVAMRCEAEAGEAEAASDVEAVRWFAPAEIAAGAEPTSEGVDALAIAALAATPSMDGT
ncbi:MAG: NUDIX hydrolase [Gluconacetobacter diazotrophicus]|nr:NUDIX hydrolase [Gluconacetobacter diazotrophicus]